MSLCLLFNQLKKCSLLSENIRKSITQNHLKIKCKYSSKKLPRRWFSEKNTENRIENYIPFTDLINFRRLQAKRSIVVQVQSVHSCKELHSYCSQYGNITHMLHYTCGVEPMHFILVEFTIPEEVENILRNSSFLDDTQIIPVQSPFLWLKMSNSKKGVKKISKSNILDIENGTKIPNNEAIQVLLQDASNVSDQMKVLYNATKLTDLGIRLRFLTARQVEMAISGMFPDAVAYPFGSSINGCGKMGCDLDLILKLESQSQNASNNRLIYQSKAGSGNERYQSQRHMEAIGDILHLFLPGCSQVRRILQARVPILKYNQQFTNIECDLSMTNMVALQMSELLYLFGELDERVRPLVFTVRKWAAEVGLTNTSPGRWITNFSLTLLVLAFLQRPMDSPPVIPSLNKIIKLSEKQQNKQNEETPSFFFKDIVKLIPEEINIDSLETLLHQFFDYYANFDFASMAITLNEATKIMKPEHSPLYIVNPLERGLNVSKNVSIEELDRLRVEFRNASWILESKEYKKNNWGISSLFEVRKYNRQIYSSRQNRLMEVKGLFDYEERIEEDKELEYKNETIKKEVDNIKRETADKIKEISHESKVKTKHKIQNVNLKNR